jgi:uncharacterized membrane protein YadS
VSAGAWEVLLLAAALICAVGFARYYVQGVLEGDRTLARAAAVGFFVLGGAAIVALWRVFT